MVAVAVAVEVELGVGVGVEVEVEGKAAVVDLGTRQPRAGLCPSLAAARHVALVLAVGAARSMVHRPSTGRKVGEPCIYSLIINSSRSA
jgi:hypothetical protein